MSNVYVRNRTPTGDEYYDIATDLYIALRRVTGNQKIFPKRCLYTDVVPMLNMWREMRDNMVKARTRYPTDEENLKARKEYLQRAIDAGMALYTQIQDAIWVIETVTPENMEQIGRLLKSELALLRSTKKNSKIQRSK